MQIVYELVAQGDSENGYAFHMRSKQVFATYPLAEKEIPEFKERCCDQAFFEVAVKETLKIKVVEREFVTA